ELGRGDVAVAQDDHRPHDGPPLLVGGGDGRRLGHRRVGDQRRLDLEGPDPVTRGDDHIVAAPLEVEPAVSVLAHAVAGSPPPPPRSPVRPPPPPRRSATIQLPSSPRSTPSPM